MIIQDDKKNSTHWKTEMVHQLLSGRNGITTAFELQAGKSYLERAVQHLHP